MAEVKRRAASIDDAKGIWNLMRDVAKDIPFDVESEAAQESVLSELMACCISGLSTVAVNDEQAVVGAVLARRDDFEWGLRNRNTVHVSYAAVAPDHRTEGVLAALFAGIQEQETPIFVSVNAENQLGLAEELGKLGFAHECKAASGWGDLYKWPPTLTN